VIGQHYPDNGKHSIDPINVETAPGQP